MERRLTPSVRRRQPAGKPHVRDSGRVVRMVVREEKCRNLANRYIDLAQADGDAASRIEQKLLVSSLDQRTGTKSIRPGYRRGGAKQGDLEITLSLALCQLRQAQK